MSHWISANGGGETWDVCKQKEEAECGFCCVAMVVNLLGHGKPLTTSMISANRHQYDRSTADRAGMQPTILTSVAESSGEVHHGGGTEIGTLGQALSSWKIGNTTHAPGSDSDMKKAIQGASRKHAVIILVQWFGGGGHWVVVVKRRTHGLGTSSTYTILDPGGYVTENTGSQLYKPTYNPSGGKFAPYYLIA